MPALLDALRGRFRQRTMTSEETIDEAVAVAAAGKTYDAAAVEAAMTVSGITLDEFERRVELRRARDAWRKDAARLDAAEAEKGKVEAAIASEEAKLAEARRVAIERCDALRVKLTAASRDADRATRARNDLLDPANVAGPLGDRYLAALDAEQAARATVGRIDRRLREAREKVALENRWLESLADERTREIKPDRILTTSQTRPATAYDSRVAEHELNLKRATRRVAEAEAELEDASAALAVASEELDRVRRKVLDS